jgi:ubiquinone/menaquinone biosynthesis C-methylase UbiE
LTLDPAEVKAFIGGVFGRAAPLYDTAIPFFQTFAGHLVDAAGLQPGEHVLDLACGRGAALLRASQVVGTGGRAVGIDLAPEMVDETIREAAERRLDNVDVRVGDAEQLEFADAAFDAVLCGFGVFFFPDPDTALAEVGRVLRLGGRFVASTFAEGIAGFQWAPDVARAIGHQHNPPPSPVLTAAGLVPRLEAAGFATTEVRHVEERFVFRDVDHYIGWHWTQGGRRLFESLSDQEMDRYRAESDQRLRDHSTEGGYELLTRVEITVAHPRSLSCAGTPPSCPTRPRTPRRSNRQGARPPPPRH